MLQFWYYLLNNWQFVNEFLVAFVVVHRGIRKAAVGGDICNIAWYSKRLWIYVCNCFVVILSNINFLSFWYCLLKGKLGDIEMMIRVASSNIVVEGMLILLDQILTLN